MEQQGPRFEAYAKFTLQAVRPVVIGVWRNAPCPLPCTSYGNFKMFKISTSEFGTVRMRRRMSACADKFLATVTEVVVHSV